MTTRVDGDPYQDLLREKGGSGFPYLVVMDVDGTILEDEVGRSLAGFRRAIGTAKAYVKLRKRATAVDAPMAVRVDYFLERLKRGSITVSAGRSELAGLKLNDEQKSVAVTRLVELEYQAIEASIKGKKDYSRAGAQFAGMKAAGRVPAGRSARSFWLLISFHAEAAKDLGLFEDCVEALTPLLRKKKRSLEKLNKRLNKLRSEVK